MARVTLCDRCEERIYGSSQEIKIRDTQSNVTYSADACRRCVEAIKGFIKDGVAKDASINKAK